MSCNLFNKNKNSDQTNSIISSLDSNQKQALAFFKDLLQNKQYSKDLEQESKSFLEDLKRNNKDFGSQNKLNQGLNCDYDDSKIENLFAQLGDDKVKRFLQQLHVMLKAINDGTLISLSSVNLNALSNLSQKQEQALEYVKGQLYVEFYFYVNDINDVEYFFERVMLFVLNTD